MKQRKAKLPTDFLNIHRRRVQEKRFIGDSRLITLFKDAAADNDALHFAGALINLGNFCISHHSFYMVFSDISVSRLCNAGWRAKKGYVEVKGTLLQEWRPFYFISTAING
jgi:hypothetical protein